MQSNGHTQQNDSTKQEQLDTHHWAAALETDIPPPKTLTTFVVDHAGTQIGQYVAVVGSCPELGMY